MLTMNIRHTIYTICQSIKTMAIGSLLCLAVQSCRQETHPLIPEDPEEVPISMNATSVEAMETSRALITDDSELQAVGFGVYATKQVASNNPVLVFNNVNVKYEATEGWDYSPKRYWDRTATYNFEAYAPYSINESTSYVSLTNILTISNIPYWQEIGNNTIDYLVANSSGTAENYLSNATSTAVSFNFSHILSQFIVHIVKDGNFAHTKYQVKKVEYINVPASDGETNYTNTSKFTDISGTSTIERFSGENEVTQTAADNTLPHLVVPFTLTDDKKVQVKVTYTVAGTERNKTVDTGITQLLAGKRYELTLTFKGAVIEPSLEIKKWEDVTVDEDPKYNW